MRAPVVPFALVTALALGACARGRACDPVSGDTRPGAAPAAAAGAGTPGNAPRLAIPPAVARPGDPATRADDEIVVCGARFHTGTKVVLWTDPVGFDAYRPHRRFEPAEALPSDGREVPRYGSFRRGLDAGLAARVAADGWRLADLQAVVHQVVLHYDAAGTSAQAFEVLHDRRGLSAHFLVDLDGTVYQTLDLKERAWHAGSTNDRSVGIEVANIGAYADRAVLDRWYAASPEGARLVVPDGVRRGALPAGATFVPARPGPIAGAIHGETVWQHDFTAAQYEALARLLAALSRVLPRCRLAAPRGADGEVLRTLLPDGEAGAAFEGVLGHWHVSGAKVDPGPAFQWDVVLERARAVLDGR